MLAPLPPTPGTLKAKVMRFFVRLHVRIYRLTRGRLGGKFSGMPLLLLDHVGRKSGRRRSTPVAYLPNGEAFVIVASNGGASWAPAWWHNLGANPVTGIQIRGKKLTVRARPAEPDERPALWRHIAKSMPDFVSYQDRTSRELDVVLLEPAEQS